MNTNIIQEFPTTHVLIDDSANYLRALSTILPLNNRIYKFFLNPRQALEWINQNTESQSISLPPKVGPGL